MFFRAVVIAVAHIDALAVFDVLGSHREVGGVDVVFELERVGLGELTGRIDRAGQDVEHRLAARFAGQIGVDERVDLVQPRHLDGGTAEQHYDERFAQSRELGHEVVVGGRQRHMRAVVALAFVSVGQADAADDRAVKVFCEFESLALERGVLAVAVERVALGVFVPDARLVQRLAYGDQLVGIDTARARALIAAVLGEFADDEQLFVL